MTDFELGRHEAMIAELQGRAERTENTVHSMDRKLDGVLLALAERKGERRMIAVLATTAGGFGSILVTVLIKLFGH